MELRKKYRRATSGSYRAMAKGGEIPDMKGTVVVERNCGSKVRRQPKPDPEPNPDPEPDPDP